MSESNTPLVETKEFDFNKAPVDIKQYEREKCGKTQGYAGHPPNMVVVYSIEGSETALRMTSKELKEILQTHDVSRSYGYLDYCKICEKKQPTMVYGLSLKKEKK